jgi:uncharacterized protein involved in type VI secretion and phage assembly
MQAYAGPGMRAQFIPHIGQQMLVGFFEQDIDRPVVVGALYDGRGEGGVPPTLGGKAETKANTELFAQSSDHQPSAQGNTIGGHAQRGTGPAPTTQAKATPPRSAAGRPKNSKAAATTNSSSTTPTNNCAFNSPPPNTPANSSWVT